MPHAREPGIAPPAPSIEAVLRADMLDAQTLRVAASWSALRAELHWIRAGLRAGYDPLTIGQILGLALVFPAGTRDRLKPGAPTSSSASIGADKTMPARWRRTGNSEPDQALLTRLRTLQQLLRYDDYDADLTRTGRREQRLPSDDPRTVWLRTHRADLVAAATALQAGVVEYEDVGFADPANTTRPWLAELFADLDEDHITPATVAVLGLVTDAARTDLAVTALEPRRRGPGSRTSLDAAATCSPPDIDPVDVRQAVVDADALRSGFSAVGCRQHWRTAPPEVDIAVETTAIVSRRRKIDDPALERFPAPSEARPHEVLQALRRWPAPERWARQADVTSALRLLNALWWEDRAEERTGWQQGLEPRCGLMASQLGSQHGLASRQGPRDRRDRLTELFAHGRPDEQLARATRQASRQAVAERAASRLSETTWLSQPANAAWLAQVATDLTRFADWAGLDELDRDMIDLLAEVAADPETQTGWRATLRLAIGEARTAHALASLGDDPDTDDPDEDVAEDKPDADEILRHAGELAAAVAILPEEAESTASSVTTDDLAG